MLIYLKDIEITDIMRLKVKLGYVLITTLLSMLTILDDCWKLYLNAGSKATK